MKSILWFMTYRCNYSCPYCWQGGDWRARIAQEQAFFAATPWVETWAGVFARLAPNLVDVTGGEPLLYPLGQLIANTPRGIQWAITTNASRMGDLLALGELPSDRLVSVTLSYHPTQAVPASFFPTAAHLASRGLAVTVNFVGWPGQVLLAHEVEETCRRSGVRFHLDPCAPSPSAPYIPATQVEQAMIDRYTQPDRCPRQPCGRVLCDAGRVHLVMLPTGATYRCLKFALAEGEAGYIGNVLQNPVVGWCSDLIPCDLWHECCGCDRDKVTVIPG